MSYLISFVGFTELWGTELRATKSKWQYLSPVGYEPATLVPFEWLPSALDHPTTPIGMLNCTTIVFLNGRRVHRYILCHNYLMFPIVFLSFEVALCFICGGRFICGRVALLFVLVKELFDNTMSLIDYGYSCIASVKQNLHFFEQSQDERPLLCQHPSATLNLGLKVLNGKGLWVTFKTFKPTLRYLLVNTFKSPLSHI